MVKIQCTQCGARVHVQDDGFVHCDACDAALFIDTRSLFLHQQIVPIFDEKKAIGLLKRWLKKSEISGLPTRLEIALQWWPLWEVENKGKRSLMLAAPSPWHELESLDISSGTRLGFSASRTGEVVLPQRCASAVLLRAGAEGNATLRLLHIPVYKLRYQIEGKPWDAFMDGVQGQIYADTMPTAQTSHLDASHAVAFALTTTIFTLEGFFIHGFWPVLLAYAVSAVALYLLFDRVLLRRMSA